MDNYKTLSLPDKPFPGIGPYDFSYKDLFFARDAEKKSLVRLISIYRGALLYAPSGVGKSSLINAGLIPDTIKEDFLPEKIRVQPKEGEEIIIQRIEETTDNNVSYLPSIFSSDPNEKRIILSTEKFLEIIHQKSETNHPLLIFDQFEEWVTLFTESSEKGDSKNIQNKILYTITSIINETTLPVKVLISLREDYLAELTPFFKICPNLVDQYVRLTPLNGDQVYKAIRGPFENYPRKYQPEINEELSKKIKNQFEQRGGLTNIRLTEVQIVASSLFESGKQGQDINTQFDSLGVQGLLEHYSSKALGALSIKEQELAISILSKLVTSAGTRNIISKENLVSLIETDENIHRDLLESTLHKLETKTPFVRRERRREIFYYELASEFLIQWIQSKAKEREKLLLEKRNEEEKLSIEKKYEEEKKQTLKKNRRRLTVAASIFLFLVTSIIYIYIKNNEIRRQQLITKAGEIAIQSIRNTTRHPELSPLLALQSVMTLEQYGEVIPAAYDALIQSLQTPTPLVTLNTQSSTIQAVSFHPDGVDLAIVYNDSVEIWNSISGKLDKTLKDFYKKVTGISYNPDGTKIAISCMDDTIRIWNTLTWEINKIPALSKGVLSIQYSPDGKRFVTINNDRYVRVWSSKTKQVIDSAKYRFSYSTFYYSRGSLAFNNDGSKLYAVIGNDFYVWKLDEKENSEMKLDNRVRSPMAIDPNGKVLVTGSGKFMIFKNLEEEYGEQIILTGHTNSIKSIAFSPDGNKLVAGSIDGSAKIWDKRGGITLLKGHNEPIKIVQFSPEGNRVVTADDNGNVKIWTVGGVKSISNFNENNYNNISDIVYKKDSLLLLAEINNDTIFVRLAGTSSDTIDAIPIKKNKQDFNFNQVAKFNSDGSLLSIIRNSDTSHSVMVRNLIAKKSYTLKTQNFIKYTDFNKDKKLAIIVYDSTVIWDMNDNIYTLKDHGKIVRSKSISFDNTGNHLITGDRDGNLIIWDISSNKIEEIKKFRGHKGGINTVLYGYNIDNKNKFIVSAGGDGIIKFWDSTGARLISKSISGVNTDAVLCLAISPDGTYLASASRDKTITIWNISGDVSKEIVTFTGNEEIAQSISFDSDGLHLISLSFTGRISFFSLHKKDLIKSARERVSRSLTPKEFEGFLNEKKPTDPLKAMGLYIEGKSASMQGNTNKAIKKFNDANKLDSIVFDFDPRTEANQIYYKTLLETSKILLKNGFYKDALSKFEEAKKINPNVQIESEELRNIIYEGTKLMEKGKVDSAIRNYKIVQELGKDIISADAWNDLCWWGCLWDFEKRDELLRAGKKAVETYKVERNQGYSPYDSLSEAAYKDSRGIAYALNDSLKEAIKDFEAYIPYLQHYREKLKQRQEWINLLNKGKNPFTKEYLKKMREDELRKLRRFEPKQKFFFDL